MNYDVIIIGAGPGGIFSAYELTQLRPDLKIAVFEAGHTLHKRHCPIDGKKIKPGTTIKGSYALNDQQMAGLIYSMETLLNAFMVNMYPSASLMSKTMSDNLHGTETNVIDAAVDDVLGRMRPALINALKNYNKGQ